jgi:hypothetical protein
MSILKESKIVAKVKIMGEDVKEMIKAKLTPEAKKPVVVESVVETPVSVDVQPKRIIPIKKR